MPKVSLSVTIEKTVDDQIYKLMEKTKRTKSSIVEELLTMGLMQKYGGLKEGIARTKDGNLKRRIALLEKRMEKMETSK